MDVRAVNRNVRSVCSGYLYRRYTHAWCTGVDEDIVVGFHLPDHDEGLER